MTMTPREYAIADTPELVAALGRAPSPGGWGLLFCTNDDGTRWTLGTQDVAYWRMLRDATPEARAGLELPPDTFPFRRPGWPDDWTRRRP
jgi:hypothetical protein